ncbi:MAG: hypothetical protein M1816_002871 [Peltula sp. TS41687]|nr:MAG: hypothetical protein M1816_002871 [Peltula sp. TS41687]
MVINQVSKRRYEIACYKNKVLEWRSGEEKDLDNVLQIPAVFTSVSKGQVARHFELENSFGQDVPLPTIILEILNKGELQVGEKERNAQLERVQNEVIDIVVGKLVDPRTKRVYTTGMIEKALAELSVHGSRGGGASYDAKGALNGPANAAEAEQQQGDDAPNKGKAKEKELPGWTGVVTTRSAKSQALDAMKALIAHQPIPVARARMRLRITCRLNVLKLNTKAAAAAPGGSAGKDVEEEGEEKKSGQQEEKSKGGLTTIKDRILSYVEQVESQEILGEDMEIVGFVEPGAFKGLGEFVGSKTKGWGRIEVLDMAVVHEGD